MPSSVRSLKCAAPETTSTLIPRAPDECILCRVARWVRWRRREAHPAAEQRRTAKLVDPNSMIN
eukprot:7790252-Alexandrium_andersonii.AAC.1